MLIHTETELGITYPDITAMPNGVIDNGVPIQAYGGHMAVYTGLIKMPETTTRMRVETTEASMRLSVPEQGTDTDIPFTCLYGPTLANSRLLFEEPIPELEIRTQSEPDMFIFWIPKDIIVPGTGLCVSAFVKRTALETRKKHAKFEERA